MGKAQAIEKIKRKWQSLQARERFYLSVACVFIALVLLYYILIAPLNDSVQSLRQQVTTAQDLATWMQPRVKALRGVSVSSSQLQTIAENELLPIIDSRLKQSSFAASVDSVSQTNTNDVRITFKKIPFDELLNWLVTQWRTSHIMVSSMDVQKGEKLGMAKVTLTLIVKS